MTEKIKIVLITADVVTAIALGTATVVLGNSLMKEKIRVSEKQKELDILKINLHKMEDFMEWEIDYMQDKINLNMIKLNTTDILRFGEKEMREAEAITKVYVEEDILKGLRKRVATVRKLLGEEKKEEIRYEKNEYI